MAGSLLLQTLKGYDMNKILKLNELASFQAVPTQFAFYQPSLAQERAMQSEARDFGMIPYGNTAPELFTRPIDYKPELMPQKPVFQLKADGISAIYINGKFWSHQGTPLHCCDHAVGDMQRLEFMFGYPLVVACEYEAGQFRETISAMRSGKPGRGTVWAYDAVPFEQWKMNACKDPLEDRAAVLAKAFESAMMVHTGLLRTMVFGDLTPAEVLEDVKRQGLEGIVIKDAYSTVTRAKSSEWLRMKVTNTFDGHIVAYNKKHIVVSVAGLGEVKVATGFPDYFSYMMLQEDQSLLGRWVEIEANVEPGSDAPRHSRFVRSREDKDS